MDLALVHAELVSDIRYSLHHIGTAPVADLAEMFDELPEQFSALGICHLLEFADTDKFRENLCRSGHCRRYFLQRSLNQGNNQDRHLAVGRTMSVLHSLAAGATNLARDIAALSQTRWTPDWEYEDDFCYYRIVQSIALDRAWTASAEATLLLDQFERALDGQFSARYALCEALYQRDRDGFIVNLESLLEEEQERIDNERTSSKVVEGDVCYWAHRNISVEALALLNLAETLGITIRENFSLCPSLARLPLQDESYLDLCAELEVTP